MKKETITALFLGIVTGAVIALILLINSKKVTIIEKNIVPTPSPEVVSLPDSTVPFAVNSPENGFTTNKNEIVIEGNATQNSLVVIQTATTEKIEKLKNKDFSMTIPLTLGENAILVANIDKKNTSERKIIIYYLPE